MRSNGSGVGDHAGTTRRELLASGARAGIGLVAFAPLLSACGGGRSASSTTLAEQTWVVPQPWPALDPVQTRQGTGRGTILPVMEPLMWAEPDGSVTPNLATKQVQRDDKTWVYTIRDGVKFSDGTPLTAEDVAFSINLHVGETESLAAADFTTVDTVEATGPLEVTIRLKVVDSTFEQAIAQASIVSQAFYEKTGRSVGDPDNLNIGTGPYMFTSFVPDDRVVLERNPDYWGDPPVCQKATLRFIPDSSARLLAVRSGELTGMYEVAASDKSAFDRVDGQRVISGPDFGLVFINLNNSKPPFDDIHVRRAMMHALDREGIVKGVRRGEAVAAPTIVPPVSLEQVMSRSEHEALYAELDRYPFDMDAARAELAQSAHPNGFSAELTHAAEEPDTARVAQVLADSVKDLGIELKVKSLVDQVFVAQVGRVEELGAVVINFNPTRMDPTSLPYILVYSPLRGVGANNVCLYENAEVDDLLTRAREIAIDDKAGRAGVLTKALRIVNEDLPVLPVYFPNYLASVKDGVGYDQFNGMWHLSRWLNRVKRED